MEYYMKRNENVHTDDIRKISSKEFAQKNVQLEDKLFSDFLRADYKAIKEDLPRKTKKQRSAVINFCIYQNYSIESIKYQLMDMTGIDDDIAEMLAIKVDENFDSLRLAYITENLTGLMKPEE
jgi:hypothetical protein